MTDTGLGTVGQVTVTGIVNGAVTGAGTVAVASANPRHSSRSP